MKTQDMAYAQAETQLEDIYGIRKAFFSSTAKDVEMYEACIKLFEASAKDATRMKSILEKMKD